MFGVLEPAGPREGVGFTVDGDRVRRLYEGLAIRFYEPRGREENLMRGANVYLWKMRPSRDHRGAYPRPP
jgi:hypothetical protein